MSLIGVISKVIIAGCTVASAGIGSALISSLPPPNSSLGNTSGSAGQLANQAQGQEATNQIQQQIPKETQHCRVLLSNNQTQNYKILACVSSNNPSQKPETWYLYDSSKKTLEEIAGFVINNDKEWKWRWGGWGWDELFIPFRNKDDDLWKKSEWQPYQKRGDQSLQRLDAVFFGLTDSSGNFPFPYYQALQKTYGTKCRYHQEWDCHSFWLKKEDLTVLSSISNLQKVCLIKKENEQNTWEIKEDCPEKNNNFSRASS